MADDSLMIFTHFSFRRDMDDRKFEALIVIEEFSKELASIAYAKYSIECSRWWAFRSRILCGETIICVYGQYSIYIHSPKSFISYFIYSCEGQASPRLCYVQLRNKFDTWEK